MDIIEQIASNRRQFLDTKAFEYGIDTSDDEVRRNADKVIEEDYVPKYVISITRERCEGLRTERWNDTFLLACYALSNVDEKSAYELLKTVAQEYLSQDNEESKKALEYSSYDFNWGDFVSFIPDEWLAKYGISLPPANGKPYFVSDIINISVNQDEVLVPDEILEKRYAS